MVLHQRGHAWSTAIWKIFCASRLHKPPSQTSNCLHRQSNLHRHLFHWSSYFQHPNGSLLLNVLEFEASKFCPNCSDIKFFRFFKVLSKHTISFNMKWLYDRFPELGLQCKLLHSHIFLPAVFDTIPVNPFPNKPWFLRVCFTSLLKSLWEKEKLLVTSNFSFSHSDFYPFGKLSTIFIKF